MLGQLFLSFVSIGALSFGGGLAALPLIQQQVVINHQWMSLTEFTNLISIAEMTPGPIAINSATFVGMRLNSFTGALIATLGCLIPSLLFVVFLGFIYFRYKELDWMKGILAGLRPAIVAMISSAGLSIFLLAIFGEAHDSFSPVSLIIFIAVFLILRLKKINPIILLLLSGGIQVVISSLM
ncbi:MAG: chromate transporter [Spirochaetaceae bacterium JB067]